MRRPQSGCRASAPHPASAVPAPLPESSWRSSPADHRFCRRNWCQSSPCRAAWRHTRVWTARCRRGKQRLKITHDKKRRIATTLLSYSEVCSIFNHHCRGNHILNCNWVHRAKDIPYIHSFFISLSCSARAAPRLRSRTAKSVSKFSFNFVSSPCCFPQLGHSPHSSCGIFIPH